VVDNLPAGITPAGGQQLSSPPGTFAAWMARQIAVFGNRARGIDGNISTALGIAASDPERLWQPSWEILLSIMI
jgi:hypothetical protein